jgi:sugar phosphate isomerase/epimerase
MGSPRLVLSHFSIRHANFAQRCRVATAAGYVGIGLYVREYERLLAAGHTGAELRAIVAGSGQQVTEFEAIRGWASTGELHETCLHHLELVDRMADELGPADHVQVIGPYEGDLDDAAAGFAMVCDRFAQHGMRAALEYFPEMSNIPDVTTALEIVERAGRPNGGLCVDSWHHFRTGDTFAALAKVPAERVVGVQFNDGPYARVDPDYYTECTSYREIPGAGEFDLAGFVRTLDGMGVDVPFEIEVISLELDRLAPDDAARRMAEGARGIIAAARAAAAPPTASPE